MQVQSANSLFEFSSNKLYSSWAKKEINQPYFIEIKLNPDYAIEFVMSVAIARKSGCLEILAQQGYGEIENSNEVTDFEAISARNRLSIAYFGLN